MLAWRVWLGSMLCVLLSGCRAAAPGLLMAEGEALPGPEAVATAAHATPTYTQEVIILDTPTATEAPTPMVNSSQTAPAATDVPSFELCSPLEIHSLQELPDIISDPYNPPPPGREERHHGVDFSYYRRGERLSIQGVGVQSVLSGNVAAALAGSFPYGNIVIIETLGADLPEGWDERLGLAAGESLYILYAHLEEAPLVDPGETVGVCQPLGTVGMSGNAGIAHLHLETRRGPSGAVFAEMQYYDTRASESAQQNYELWRTSGVFRHFNPMDLLLMDP